MQAALEDTLQADTPSLITGEALYALENNKRSELIEGKLKIMPPTGFLHGRIEVTIARKLGDFVESKKLGQVLGGEVGIYIQRSPDTIRGADVLYISQQRMEQVKSNSYLDVAPELVVEVLSPNDSWAEVNRKLADYFSIHVDRVWIVDPSSQSVHIYKSLTDIRILQQKDTVNDEEILPDFACKVLEFFS